MNKHELKVLFDSFAHKKIVNIGDIMIDSYMWGKVNRISPEAPVPVLASTSSENRLGGAANVALNIKSLGAIPILCAIAGKDKEGEILKQLLEKRKMTNEGIKFLDERTTTTKTRIISNNQHLLRVDEEHTNPLIGKAEEDFVLHVEKIIENNDISAIIFEDYDKGAVTPLLINSVTTIAKTLNIPVLVDPKKRNFNEYNNVKLFKPNFKEIQTGLKFELKKGDFDALKTISEKLHERNIDIVFTTLSELGVFISTKNETYSIPAQVVDIADVSGAGDTVISVAALCLIAGIEIQKIAEISNLAGGLVCEKTGVVPINKDKLIHECIKYFNNEEK